MIYRNILKRPLDFILALWMLVLTSPVLIIVSIILFFTNKRKVFFVQLRPGLKGKIFSIMKFRTMNDKKDINGVLLSDNDRITSFGMFLRKSSIDELPQIFNVLKGDISFIGPRPLLIDYLPLYNEYQRRRHDVRPGITGWAQVNGRNSISWNEKFSYDVWYVDNLSFELDMKIFFLTFLKIIKSEGVNSSEVSTMIKFTGNN